MQKALSHRGPAAAALMPLILPGFGQLYNGDVNRAIWQFLIFTVLTGPGIAAVALHAPSELMLPLMVINLGLALGLWLWRMYDAWRGARGRLDRAQAS